MTKISSVNNVPSTESRPPKRSSQASKEVLIAEFSRLLQSISSKLASREDDLMVTMDLQSAPVIKNGAKKVEKNKKPEKEAGSEEVTLTKTESPEKEEEPENIAPKAAEESPKKEEVKETATQEAKDENENAPVPADKPEEEKKAEASDTEQAPVTTEEEASAQSVPATAVEAAVVSQDAAAVASPAVVAQAAAGKSDEASSESPKAPENIPAAAEQNANDEATADAKQAAQESAEAAVKEGEDSNSDGKAAKQASEASETQDAQTQAAAKNGKAKGVLPEATPEVKAAEKAIEKALAANSGAEKAVNALETQAKAVLQNAAILQSLEPKGKLSATLSSQQTVMQFMRELSSVTSVSSGNNGNGFSLPGLASIKTAPEQSNASTVRQNAPLPRSVQTQTIARIEDALREVAKSPDGKTVSLRLDPPELGKVKIEVTYKEGTLSAKIVAESQQVTSVIRDKAFELQAMLRKLGISAERIVVQVGQEQSAGQEASGQSFSSQTGPEHDQQQSQGPAVTELFRGLNEGTTMREAVQTDDHWVA